MDKIDIFEPTPNQILVFDEITQKFVNRDPGEVIKLQGIDGAVSMGDYGVPIFNKEDDGILLFRQLSGGNQITVRNLHSYIEISFDGDAHTFRGKSPDDFLKPENNLTELDPIAARNTLNLYNKNEIHDVFMETNASNIPDKDNFYDLGSNGRRYADMYAVTFHGTATRALYAERLLSMSASDGDALVWSGEYNDWRPKTPKKLSLTDLDNMTGVSPKDGDILQYNSNNGQWELVEYVPYEAADDGSIVALNSTGNGHSIIRSRAGDIVELRSLRAGSNIEISPVSFNNEISIRAIVPNTTDDLPEGDDNLYFNGQRVLDEIRTIPLFEHSDVTNTTPQNGQGLIRIDGKWVNKDVPYELYTTDDLTEGESNLYHTTDRVISIIHQERDNEFMSLDDLSNTNPSNIAGTYLYYNGLNWVNRKIESGDISETSNLFYTNNRVIAVVNDMLDNSIPLSRLTDVNISGLGNNQVLMSDGTNWLNRSLTTSHISEGNKMFYTEARVETKVNAMINEGAFSIDTLNDVNVDGATNGDFMVYDASQSQWVSKEIELTYPLFNNYRTKSVVSTTTINIEAAAVHRIDGTVNRTLSLVGATQSNEGINIIVCIEGYGGTFTWPANINWNNGSEPTWGPNWTNIILFWTGSMWIGMLSARG